MVFSTLTPPGGGGGAPLGGPRTRRDSRFEVHEPAVMAQQVAAQIEVAVACLVVDVDHDAPPCERFGGRLCRQELRVRVAVIGGLDGVLDGVEVEGVVGGTVEGRDRLGDEVVRRDAG